MQEAEARQHSHHQPPPELVAVLAEQLRHPIGVVGLEWSPGALQHGA